MRFITILLSLISFSSFANYYAVESLKLTDSELQPSDKIYENLYLCEATINSSNSLKQFLFRTVDVKPASCVDLARSSLLAYTESPFGPNYPFEKNTNQESCVSTSTPADDGSATYQCVISKRFKHVDPDFSFQYQTASFTVEVRMTFSMRSSTNSCDYENSSQKWEGPIKKDNEIAQAPSWCYLPSSVGDPVSKCPEPSPDDIQVFGTTSGYQTHCFNNPDGTQCHIQTDETGYFVKPAQYASQEIAECDVSNQDPNPDPDPTDDPDPHNDGEDTDNSDQTNELDALNQVNDNITIMNDNINNANSSLISRLEQTVGEIRNTNQLLSDVKNSNYDTAVDMDATNNLLEQISQKLDSEDGENETPISATAGRKTGGLNDLFGLDKLSALEAETTQTQTDLKEYYSQIQSEIKSMFDIQINATGAYEERTMVLKGQSIDYGLGRFATFWQSLAPVVLFVFSCLALYAVLGGVRA